jgi:hypothetical protein
MRFKNEGIAFAHLTLPPDTFLREGDVLAARLKRLGGEYANHKISYLTGQSDLLLELRLSDLRLAFRLEYESSAVGTNWLFAIPFDHVVSPRSVKPSDLALQYVMHLRVNRDLYRAKGAAADKEIVDAILKMARGKLTAEVSAAFGWSDILVNGEFVRRDDFTKFLGGLHHLRIGSTAASHDAFRRILTIIGYERDTDFKILQSTEVFHPVIFARSLPTHIGRAADFLECKVSGNWRKVVVDGKWDIIISLADEEGVPAKDFLQHHRSLITSGELTSAGVQRLETHLLSKEISASDDAPAPANEVIPGVCSICSAAVRSEDDELVKSADLLPASLTMAIRNVLNLFRAASREANTCCDIVPSLVRCEIGLDRLLRHHRVLYSRMEDVSKIDTATGSLSAARWAPHVIKARHDIEAWCTYAERIVSQRTVGRFEEFLAQNERVVSYRGGIQKLLYLADALLNSYAQRVYASVEEPALMCLYDPIDLVESMRVVGFVRIPVRYVFVLPLAISHLWHEVGVHWFYSKYWNPIDVRSRRRAMLDFHAMPPDESSSPTQERVDLLIDLADVYGDAVTLLKGFRGDLTQFMVSLATTLLESNAFKSAPAAVRIQFLKQLMVRLYLALEFWQRCSFVRERLCSESMTFNRLELDNWIPDATVFVVPAVARIARILGRELLEHDRYKEVEISAHVEQAAVGAIGEVVNSVHRRYLSELAWEMGAAPLISISTETHAAFREIMAGEIPSLVASVDINDLFLLAQQQMIRTLRDAPPGVDATSSANSSFLRPLASLVRASILAFYGRSETEPVHRRSRSSDVESLRLRDVGVATSHDLFDDEDVNA